MHDQELNSEELEVAPQETDVNETEVQDQEHEIAQPEVDEQQDEQERNWRAMRQRQKELEWQLQQKEQMINEFIQSQRKPSPQQQPEESFNFDPSDYSTYEGVEKLAGKKVQPLEKKIAELEAKIAEQEQKKLLNGLKAEFPDFDDVVNVETLELFEKTEPKLAATIDTSDPYKFGIQAYKLIKAYGIQDNLPGARRKKEVERKLEQNKKTVQTPQAYEKRPMAQAFRTTQSDSKKLYEEMMYYAGKATGF